MLFQWRKQIVAQAVDFAPTLISWFSPEKKWSFTIEDYRQMPLNSLGRSVGDYLDDRGFSFVYNGHHHDIRHILLNYDMNPEGEVRMQAFMVGNNWTWNYKGWLAFLFGLVMLPELWGTLAKDWKRGKKARKINQVKWKNFLNDPIDELRLRFNIVQQ